MSRWLYNTLAVRAWAPDEETLERDPYGQRNGIAWWSSSAAKAGNPRTHCFYIGDFVGHGRSMHYCGLVSAFMNAVEREELITGRDSILNVLKPLKLEDERPRCWYITAIVSLLLVWTEIFLAVVVDVFTPTIGFGCWSGSIVLYALLSMVSWLVQFRKRPGKVLMAVAHVFNTLAILWILAATFMVVSYCSPSPIGSPH